MDIVFYDDNIIVCVKPVGLDSEQGVPDLLREELGGEIFTVHRLDLNVGGIMVYARNKQTAAELSACIQNGEMIKEYLAVVHGAPPAEGDWADLLYKDPRKNKVFVVDRMRRGVKRARLEFKRLSKGKTSLVRIRLHTGRSHQIRVQFASRKFPLVGDHKYGARDNEEAPLLYSCKLTFPYKGESVSFESTPEW
ncbi:MAG: RNA pseudouridine synthase [Clostridia bacterium]|nr:RNA pseudouridine synthase [Clostridia bacterium]